MRTVVVYKWAGGPGEDDHAAVAVARGIAESAAGELAGLTLGGGDTSWALARGVPSAVRITDAPVSADESATAALLAAAIRASGGADVVVIGDAEGYAQVPAALAGHLGASALLDVAAAVVSGGVLTVRRAAGATEETIQVSGPVVLAVSAAGPEERAPGMKEMLAARKRPVENRTVAELTVPATAGLDEIGTRPPESGTARVFTGDPADAARRLVAALRSEGVL